MVLLWVFATSVSADEAALRKRLAEKVRQLPPADEIRKTPVPGLYEVRIGAEVFYSDETASHLIRGSILQTDGMANLTEARLAKLAEFRFSELALNDAVVIKQGSGKRKLAVFSDPHCGYCKRLEKDLAQLKDVTIYVFLYPVLGRPSEVQARSIWCAKDKGSAWRRWMLDEQQTASNGECDAASVNRNVAFGKSHRVTGTPALVFEDGSRIAGAASVQTIEERLGRAKNG